MNYVFVILQDMTVILEFKHVIIINWIKNGTLLIFGKKLKLKLKLVVDYNGNIHYSHHIY